MHTEVMVVVHTKVTVHTFLFHCATRNHLPVPTEADLDPSQWRLSVGGQEAHSVNLSLEDLKTKQV